MIKEKDYATGEIVSRTSEFTMGYGAGSGSIKTTVYKCKCGKGTVTEIYDDVPGFKERDWIIDCPICVKDYLNRSKE